MDVLGLGEIERLPGETVVTVGVFDGVHRGHREIVRTAREAARRRGCTAVVVTFDPHPAEVVAPDRRLPLLTTVNQRTELLGALGVDIVVIAHDLRSLFALPAEAFVDQVLVAKLRAQEVVEGPDWTFGRGRQGTMALLRRLGAERGVAVTEVPWLVAGGRRVSSTAIREMLAKGEVRSAAGLLGRHYFADGTVIRGAGRGKGLGVPTANIRTVNEVLPAPGVYAGTARVAGQPHTAAIFVGPSLTFGSTKSVFEVHLVDFPGGDMHGAAIRVAFADRLRDNRRFDSPDALAVQMRRDIDEARGIVGSAGQA